MSTRPVSTKKIGGAHRWLAVVVMVAVTAAGSIACGGSNGVDDEVVTQEILPERARHNNLVQDGLTVEKADLNGDDRPDQWSFFDEAGTLVRVERDLNFNGQVDMWQYFDESGALIEEEMNLDASGAQVDVVAFYENGKVVRKIMGIGFDGSFPIEKFYDGQERVLRVERDSTGDGQVDVWEYFENGERRRVGWDTTGDGQPNRFDQL
jgi:hypothetical protein